MKVKVSTMCRIIDKDLVLVQERSKNDWPGITFPGGKLENNESVYDCCVREVKEETGLDVSNLKLCGIIHYQLFEKDEKWIIYLYETHMFEGTLFQADGEDKIYFMPISELTNATLSNDLDVYLQIYEKQGVQEAYATWYGNTSSDFTIYG